MKKTIGTISAALTLLAAPLFGSCTSTRQTASASVYYDDMYGSYDREAAVRAQAEREAAIRAEAEARRAQATALLADTDTQTRTVSATDGIVLEPLQPQQDSYVEGYVDGYESGYQRKLSMFEDPYYVRPASYYNYYYDTAYFLDGIYGPGYYDVSLVAGNLVVTPVYLTPWNNWGFWGSPYYWWSPGFYFGSYYSPYWGWGWNWGFNWYWGWDYWYPHYAPYPPHHHGPYYSYRPHSSTNSSYRYGSSASSRYASSSTRRGSSASTSVRTGSSSSYRGSSVSSSQRVGSSTATSVRGSSSTTSSRGNYNTTGGRQNTTGIRGTSSSPRGSATSGSGRTTIQLFFAK